MTLGKLLKFSEPQFFLLCKMKRDLSCLKNKMRQSLNNLEHLTIQQMLAPVIIMNTGVTLLRICFSVPLVKSCQARRETVLRRDEQAEIISPS